MRVHVESSGITVTQLESKSILSLIFHPACVVFRVYLYKDVIVHFHIYVCAVYDVLFLKICQLKTS
jgi:hypothetical protein